MNRFITLTLGCVAGCVFSGCVALPMGERELEVKEYHETKKKKAEEIKLSTVGSDEKQTVKVKAVKHYDLVLSEKDVIEKKISRRKLVLGLYPGIGVINYGDRKLKLNDKGKEIDSCEIIVQSAVANGIYLLTGGWMIVANIIVGDSGNDWDRDTSPSDDEVDIYSILGWGKTYTHVIEKEIVNESESTLTKQENCPGVKITATANEQVLETVITDKDGIAEFHPQNWDSKNCPAPNSVKVAFSGKKDDNVIITIHKTIMLRVPHK